MGVCRVRSEQVSADALTVVHILVPESPTIVTVAVA